MSQGNKEQSAQMVEPGSLLINWEFFLRVLR